MIEDFENAFKSVKNYQVNFKNDAELTEGLKAEDGELVSAPVFVKTEKEVASAENAVLRLGSGGIFGFKKRGDRYYFTDGKGREKNVFDGGFKTLPETIDLNYRGKKPTFIIYDAKAISTEEPFDSVPVIKGEKYFYKDGVLYCVDGDCVLFCGPFGYPTRDADGGDGGFIRFTGEKITGLAVGERAFAFTDEKVYAFSPENADGEYSAECVLEKRGVRGNSAAVYGKGCLFICGKDLYYSDGKNSKCVFGDFLPVGYFQTGKPEVSGGEYLLPVSDCGENKKIAVFDGETRYFTDASGLTLVTPFIAVKDGFVYERSEGDGIRRFVTKPIDAGNGRLKTVCGIKTEAYGEEITLTVSGDFGERLYQLKSGTDFLRVSLSSKNYSLTVGGKIEKIKKLQLYYRNREVLYGI